MNEPTMKRRRRAVSAKQATKRVRLGPGRLSAEDAAQLPDRLLDAALKHFSEVGYAETTMDMIAKEAGASTKTLYARYANKNEIMQAVVRRNVERTVAAHLLATHLNPEKSEPRAFLQGLGLQIGLALNKETTGITRLTFAQAHRFPVLLRLYEEVTGRGIGVIRRAIETWREDGKIGDFGDSETAATLCFDLMTSRPRIFAILGAHLTRAELEEYVSAAVDMFLRSCGTPKAPRRVGKT